MKKTSLWCIVFVLLLSIIIIYTSCGVEVPTKSVAHSEQVLENNLKEESISALSPYLVTTCTGIFNNQVTHICLWRCPRNFARGRPLYPM